MHLSPPEGQKQDKLASPDSGAVDSGFLSGNNLSSDSFSSSELREAPTEQSSQSGSQNVPSTAAAFKQNNFSQQQKHRDPQELDSDVGFCSGESMHVEDLCAYMRKMPFVQKPSKVTWEPYFHQNDDGDTYLHLAVIDEAAGVAENLVRVAARPWLDIQNDIGQTPLHLAVLTEQPKIVRRLIVAGAKPGIRDVEGNTALHLACLHRRNDCASALLTALTVTELQQSSPAAQAVIKIPQDLEQWNYNGKRCVHIAAETSNVEMLRYLISAGADINSREGKAGLTPLHIAIETGNEPLVNFLLEECPKLRLEQVTYAGLTPYQLAALQHNQKLQNRLRSRGAEPLTPPESDYEEDDESSEEDEQ